MTADELKSEIVRCLKAGPGGWTEVQQSLSSPSKWLVSAARGKRSEGEIAVDFKKKFPSSIGQAEDDERDMVRESVAVLRAQVFGLRDWKDSQDKDLLFAFPAAQLIEVHAGEAPADWQQRWQRAGGKLVEGKCVALKTDGAWARFSEFGQPHEPFDWAAALGREDLDRADAKRWGLIIDPPRPSSGLGCMIVLGLIVASAAAGVALAFS
jgi:hypothetical protein